MKKLQGSVDTVKSRGIINVFFLLNKGSIKRKSCFLSIIYYILILQIFINFRKYPILFISRLSALVQKHPVNLICRVKQAVLISRSFLFLLFSSTFLDWIRFDRITTASSSGWFINMFALLSLRR